MLQPEGERESQKVKNVKGDSKNLCNSERWASYFILAAVLCVVVHPVVTLWFGGV